MNDADFLAQFDIEAHTKFLADRACYWKGLAKRVEKDADEAAGQWRELLYKRNQETEDFRSGIHEILGLEVPHTNEQLLEALRAALDLARQTRPEITHEITIGGWTPNTEDIAAAAMSFGGRAPIVVDPAPVEDGTEHLMPVPGPGQDDTWDPATGEQPAVEPFQATAAESSPSLPAITGLTGRRWIHGDLNDGPPEEIPIAVVTRAGDVWDFAGFNDNATDSAEEQWNTVYGNQDSVRERYAIYANQDRTDVASLPRLLRTYGELFEVAVKPAEMGAQQ